MLSRMSTDPALRRRARSCLANTFLTTEPRSARSFRVKEDRELREEPPDPWEERPDMCTPLISVHGVARRAEAASARDAST